MAAKNFLFRELTPSDIPDLIQLARTGLGVNWSESFVRWKYFQNPAGQIYGWCAEHEGQQVGVYGNTPVQLKVGEQPQPGAQAVDAIVQESVRRHGVFVRLANESYRQMDQAGVALTYAFPNPVSQKVFLERLGWTSVGLIPRYVKVLNPKAIVASTQLKAPRAWIYRILYEYVGVTTRAKTHSKAGAIPIREIHHFDTQFDIFWKAISGQFPYAVIRDSTYLNWRYTTNPLRTYKILAAERDSKLSGFAVLSLRDVQRDGVLAITELLIQPGDQAAGMALLRRAELIARASNASQLQCWMLPRHTFYTHLLLSSGFTFRPIGIAPKFVGYVTPLIVRLHPDKSWSKTDPTLLSNWYVSMGDHDYY